MHYPITICSLSTAVLIQTYILYFKLFFILPIINKNSLILVIIYNIMVLTLDTAWDSSTTTNNSYFY